MICSYCRCGITVDHWSFYILLTVIITELMVSVLCFLYTLSYSIINIIYSSLCRFCCKNFSVFNHYVLQTLIAQLVYVQTLSALIVLVVVGVRARRQRMSNCAMIILESEQEQRNLRSFLSLLVTYMLRRTRIVLI